MASRVREYVPGEFPLHEVGIEQAYQRSLALEIGATISGIQTREELLGIFAAQAERMARDYDPDLSDAHLEATLRNMGNDHLWEEPFWCGLEDEGLVSEGTNLRVLIPYAPQYGESLGQDEWCSKTPLHMTFGLSRTITGHGQSVILAARTNIWLLTRTWRSEGISAHKDTNSYQEFDTTEQLEHFFGNRQRSARHVEFLLSLLAKSALS